MTTDKDSPQLFVAVDASKVARCNWCGTLQSDNWKEIRTGIYCSNGCADASNNQRLLASICIAIVAAPIVLLLPVPTGLFTAMQRPMIFTFVGVLVFPFFVILIYGLVSEYRRVRIYKNEVPKASRMDEGIEELVLVRSAKHVECPNCDGNIDLSKVKADMIYHCEYCGASGKVEILKTE